MHLYLLVPMLACVGCAASAGMLLARSTAYGTSRAGAQILIGGAFWALCEIAWTSSADPDTVLWLVRASALGWVWLGPSVAQLFLDLDPEPWPWQRTLLRSQYALGAAFLLVEWATPWMHREVLAVDWGWSYRVGSAFPPFYLYTMANVALGVAWGRRAFRANRSPSERAQGAWLAVAVLIPLLAASLTDVVLPWQGVDFPRFGSLSLAALGMVLSGNILYFGYSVTAPWTFRQEMLAILPEGVALLGLDGDVRTCNEALARLVGVAAPDLEGRGIRAVVPEAPVVPAREVRDEETLLHTAQGEKIPVALSSTLVRDRRDVAIGLVLVVRDLTEVVSLRNRLVTSGRLAAVGELAASIAHEVNNPLAFIRTNLSLLESHWKALADAVDPGRLESLEELVHEGRDLIAESMEGVDRTAAFVRDVKGFSHAGAGEREPADPNRLIESVLRVAAAQNHDGARIVTDLGDVPLVWCARQELKQVFLNLLINAIQATDEGGTIEIHTHGEPDAVVVTVEDDGAGIDPEHVDRIYDPFFTTKPVGEGTGLGLAISREIVRRHGGSIDLQSSAGTGTRFTVRIPVGEPDDEDA